jgi:tungstate transport system permease protein
VTAVAIASVLGLALGSLVAVSRFPGRGLVIAILNATMGLPPVVIGLLVYLLLSRAGPLGSYGLLFTPTAMVIAQVILITPIIAALSRQTIEDSWREYREQLASLGVRGVYAACAEVGAVMIVGGNIDGVTRVMTTAIALETTKGDLPLALSLGIVLVMIVLAINVLAQALKSFAERRYG